MVTETVLRYGGYLSVLVVELLVIAIAWYIVFKFYLIEKFDWAKELAGLKEVPKYDPSPNHKLRRFVKAKELNQSRFKIVGKGEERGEDSMEEKAEQSPQVVKRAGLNTLDD